MADISGTNGNDNIIGTPGNDTISSGNGNDTVNAGAGNDTVYAGNGDDTVYGGSGMDTLFGENGNDIIDGGTDDDIIDGGNGTDKLYGGAGNDKISGGNGADLIYGGSGNDTIGSVATRCNEDSGSTGENGGDTIFGDGYDSYLAGQAVIPTGAGTTTIAGNDIIFAGNGNDIIWGDNGNNTTIGGNDIIYAGKGNDTVYGEGGNDRLMGEAGNDAINGGAGNDIIVGGLGLDTMTGGTGNDKFVFSAGLESSDHDEHEDANHEHHGYDHDNEGNWTDSSNAAKDVITDFTAIKDAGATPSQLDLIDLTQLLGATDLNWGGTTPTANGVWYVKDIPNNVTYVYADINGNPATPELAIKLLGLHDLTNGDFCGVKNAGVTIVTGGTTAPGTITEIVDNAVGENSALFSATGLIDFNDTDFGSVHTASVAATPASYLGTFTLGVLNDVNTTVGWDFKVNDLALDYLAAGQQLVQNYSVTISDGLGGTVTQVVKVTITGTNDAPIVSATNVTGSITELTSAPIGNLTNTGTLTFTDVDLSDIHSIGAVTPSASALGSLTASVTADSTGTGLGGVVTWNYSVVASAVEFLAAGQTKIETFAFNVLDGKGGSVPRTVTITVTGTNDAPTIVALGTNATAAITEDSAPATLIGTGVIAFNDVDLIDVHAVSAVPGGSNTLGGSLTFTAVTESATTSGGSVGWSYSVANSATQYLALGQQVTETFTVTVNDGKGGTVTQLVSVVITGTNDAPTIVALGTDAIGAITEDSSAVTLTDTGMIAFNDVDLTDVHSILAVASGTNTLGGLLSFGAVTESPATSGGSVGWTYSVANSATQYLALGQQVTENFTVTVNDGMGGTTTQAVTITVTGTNDAPVITSAASTPAAVAELTSASAQDLAAITGTFAVSDLDVGDALTASVVGSPIVLLNGGAFTLPAGATALTAGSAFTLTGATSNGGSTTIGYTYDPAAANLDFLRAGQSLTVTYGVKVNDGTADSATQNVTFTITGTNDVPVLSAASAPAAVAELTSASAQDLAAITGTFAVNDLDIGDTLTASIVGGPTVLLNGGAFILPAGAIALTAGGAFALTGATSNGGATTVGYTYDPSAANLDFLAAGQTLTVTYGVRVNDGTTNSATQNVTFTITGTNDAPIVSAADVTGAITELVAAVGNITDTGTLTFTDVDLTDTHSLSAITASSGALGALTASVSSDTTGTGTGGVITWNYSVAASAVEFLAAGQTKLETFSFNMLDGNGGSTARTVSVTITGTNDAPDILLVGTDSAAKTLTETNAALSTSGTLTVRDVDLTDTVASSVLSVAASGTTTGLTLTNAQMLAMFNVTPAAGLAANPTDTNNLAWTFSSSAVPAGFDYLATGGSLVLTYTIRSTDTALASDTQSVTITINGTNDGPIAVTDNIITNVGVGNSFDVAEWALLANDIDPDGGGALDVSTIAGQTGLTASHTPGTLSNGFVSINDSTPAGGSFTYLATDGTTVGTTGAVNVTQDLLGTLDGTAGADIIISANGGATLQGNAGNDILLGGGGNDTYVFGLNDGNDIIRDSGSGSDAIQITSSVPTNIASLNFERVGTDLVIQVSATTITIDDHFAAGATNVESITFSNVGTVYGYALGTNAYRLSTDASGTLDGGGQEDVIASSSTTETLSGANGNDLLFGNAGDDTISGNNGNDLLVGGLGDDRLIGGADNDVLFGGADNDTFVFSNSGAANSDSVYQFNASGSASDGDFIELSAGAFSGIGGAGNTLATGDFTTLAGTGATASVGGSVNVIYDSTTGNLYYDSDGGNSANRAILATINLSNPADTFDFNDIKVGT